LVVVLAATGAAYGIEATTINAFDVFDAATLNPFYTAATTVSCSIEETAADGATITGFLVTETDYGVDGPPIDEPELWSDLPILSYGLEGVEVEPGVIEVPEGMKTIYAWVKDSNGDTASASDWIVYSTNSPTITILNERIESNLIEVLWDTDSDAIGWITVDGIDRFFGPSEYGQLGHMVVVDGLLDAETYTLNIHSDAAVETIVRTTAAAEPIQDANITWSGDAAPDLNWSRGVNWEGLRPPAVTNISGSVTFGEAGSAPEDVTSVLDPQALDELADTWQIYNLSVATRHEDVLYRRNASDRARRHPQQYNHTGHEDNRRRNNACRQLRQSRGGQPNILGRSQLDSRPQRSSYRRRHTRIRQHDT